ncbi:MAG: LPXTG cell wall anchor domain-containing protein, partial [Eubacteriales bacterium]|nr:LPXTG cell wall anchor domain-containing protein [Eubacteriales bacterium]
TCSRCDFEEIKDETQPLGHKYDEGKITRKATEDREGEMTFTCERCGDSYTESIPRLDPAKTEHEHDYQKTAETEPTCTEPGKVTKTCRICGDVKTEEIDALGHDYDTTEETAPTCTEPGKVTKTCRICGDVKTEKIDALGHDYEAIVTKEASAEEDGEKTYTCSRCGDSYTESIPKLTPLTAPGEEETATETAQMAGPEEAEELPLKVAGKQVTSENCGDIRGDNTVKYDSEKHVLTLDNAQLEYNDSNSEDSKEHYVIDYEGTDDLTIEILGICSITSNSSAAGICVKDKDDNNMVSLNIEGTGTLTITLQTQDVDTVTAITAEKDITLYKETAEKAVTSENEKDAPGALTMSAKHSCLNAGGTLFIYGGTITADATGDRDEDENMNALYGGKGITIAETLEIAEPENGNISSFSNQQDRTIKEEDNDDPAARVVIKPKSEDPQEDPPSEDPDSTTPPASSSDYTITFRAGGGSGTMEDEQLTPNADGTVSFTLPDCEFTPPQWTGDCNAYYVFSRWQIKADEENATVEKAEAGTEITISKNTIISALWAVNHSRSTDTLQKIEKAPATCETEGYSMEHYRCSVCGKRYRDAEGTRSITDSIVVIAPTGHSPALVEKVDATCENAGTSEHYKCSACGKLFSDEKGETEITEESIAIPATGHSISKVEKVDPTCVRTGTKEHYKCSACNKLFTDEEGKSEAKEEDLVIAVLPHTISKVEAVAPTCAKEGTKEHYTCSVCNKLFSDADGKTETTAQDITLAIDPDAHSWTVTFNWNEKFESATASFTCKNDPDHKGSAEAGSASASKDDKDKEYKEGKVIVEGSIKLPLPTTTESGKCVRTAKVLFDGKEYSEDHDLEIKPAGNEDYKWISTTTSTASNSTPTYTWTKGTKNPLSFRIKRTMFDTITYEAFTGYKSAAVEVDSKTIDKKNYTTEKGSLILKLDSSYLSGLSAGTHTLKVKFQDGTAETKFTVKAASGAGTSTTNTNNTSTKKTTTGSAASPKGTATPKTGDYTNWALWIGVAAASVAAILIILWIRRRGKRDGEPES